MIESICSKEEEELQLNRISPMVRMPKNIRQIGQIEGSRRIYVEDYVMTYIRQLAVKNVGKYHIAVLLGKYVKSDENRNILISGAVEVKEVSFDENMTFSNEAWTSIYEDIKRYFSDVEIVGWLLARAGLSLEVDERVKKVHLDNFAGVDKTLLMYDSMEREEAFYLFDGVYHKRLNGYYIYYEKNEDMQSYMIDQKGAASEESEYEDKAIKEIRTIIAAKKEVPHEKKLVRLFYGASTVLAAVVLVIGVTILNNYDKMKQIEETLNGISNNIENNGEEQEEDPFDQVESSEDKNETSKETMDVDTVSGNVTTIKEEDVISDESSKSKPKKVTKEKEAANSKQIYVVEKGDTLASISKKVYNSANYIDKIMKANDIEDQDKIFAGQKLIMP